jgi:hypothetical protein
MSIKAIVIVLLLSSTAAFACDTPETLSAIHTSVSEKLLQNAPTFRHGWEDKEIQLLITNTQRTVNGCQATLQMTLPQTDIDAVNAELDAQPAKRILLGAQGYRIPEQTISIVDYYYLVEDGAIIQKNDANTPLKSLYSSIEYMYQSLAQSRIVLNADADNQVAWSEAERQLTNDTCESEFNVSNTNTQSLATACACRTQKLSEILSARQMELVVFVQSQPYSAATGVLKSYINVSKPINDRCGLVSRS